MPLSVSPEASDIVTATVSSQKLHVGPSHQLGHQQHEESESSEPLGHEESLFRRSRSLEVPSASHYSYRKTLHRPSPYVFPSGGASRGLSDSTTPFFGRDSRATSIGSATSASRSTLSAAHSRHSSRDYKETLDAQTRDEKDGTRIINQYHLVQVIGKGAYGVVFRACLLEDPDSLFAVKELSKTRLRKSKRYDRLRRPTPRGRGGALGSHGDRRSDENNPEVANSDQVLSSPKSDPLELIRKEIAIMKKLDHPNVLALFEALDDPSRDELYIVVEYCPDGPLIDIKLHEQTEPLTEEAARDYFVQILLGIEYLHSNDIIHRDIKPDNVLLCDGRRTCKIVDFGVSEMFSPTDTATKPSEPRAKGHGTPAFLSPELCSIHAPAHRQSSDAHSQVLELAEAVRQRETNGRRDDLWAVGVTLYCMVVGHLPFDKSNFLELYEAIRNKEPEYPSFLSLDCINLLQAFLSKDSKRRPSIEQAREHPWITRRGSHPFLSAAENLQQIVSDVTEDEIKFAICNITSVFTIARAVSRFKRAKSRSNLLSASQSSNEDGTTGVISALTSPQSNFSASFAASSPNMQRSFSGDGSVTFTLTGRQPASRPPISAASCQSPSPLIEDPERESDEAASAPGLPDVSERSKAELSSPDLAEPSLNISRDSVQEARALMTVAAQSVLGEPTHHFSQAVRHASRKLPETAPDSSKPCQELLAALPRIVSGVLNYDGDDNAFKYRQAASTSRQGCGNSLQDCREQQARSSLDSEERLSRTDSFLQALREVETRIEHIIKNINPISATKHLANRLQPADPVTRLDTSLKGLGLNLSGWASENNPDARANDFTNAAACSAQDQESQGDASLADETVGVKSSKDCETDTSGRHLRTGRGSLQETASFDVTRDRRSLES